MLLEQIGASHADDQDRRVADPAEQVLDQVQEGRLRPLQVVEGDDERRVASRGARAAGGPPTSSPPGALVLPAIPIAPAIRAATLVASGSPSSSSLDPLAGDLARCPPDEVSAAAST